MFLQRCMFSSIIQARPTSCGPASTRPSSRDVRWSSVNSCLRTRTATLSSCGSGTRWVGSVTGRTHRYCEDGPGPASPDRAWAAQIPSETASTFFNLFHNSNSINIALYTLGSIGTGFDGGSFHMKSNKIQKCPLVTDTDSAGNISGSTSAPWTHVCKILCFSSQGFTRYVFPKIGPTSNFCTRELLMLIFSRFGRQYLENVSQF